MMPINIDNVQSHSIHKLGQGNLEDFLLETHLLLFNGLTVMGCLLSSDDRLVDGIVLPSC